MLIVSFPKILPWTAAVAVPVFILSGLTSRAAVFDEAQAQEIIAAAAVWGSAHQSLASARAKVNQLLANGSTDKRLGEIFPGSGKPNDASPNN